MKPSAIASRRTLGIATVAATVAALYLLAWPPVEATFAHALHVPLYRRLLGETLKLAALCTLICLLLGYPLAWALRMASDRTRRGLVFGVVAPVTIGAAVRALGWLVVLGEFGLVNIVLRTLRLEADIPRRTFWMSELAVLGGMVQVFFPFMVLALYRALRDIPTDTIRAVRSLGATRAQVFRIVVLPESLPGAVASVAMVFALATGAYVTVAVFGSRRVRALAGFAFDDAQTLLTWQIGAVAAVAAIGAVYAVVRWLLDDPASRG